MNRFIKIDGKRYAWKELLDFGPSRARPSAAHSSRPCSSFGTTTVRHRNRPRPGDTKSRHSSRWINYPHHCPAPRGATFCENHHRDYGNAVRLSYVCTRRTLGDHCDTMARMAKGESEFDKLARLIKEEGEDIREEMGSMEKRLERKMDEGFSTVNRRLDQILQMQLGVYAGRLKKLETAAFPK